MSPTATRLVEHVRTNVAALLDEFAALTAGSRSTGTGVAAFTQRLSDYVMRFGSMRRTRMAAHTLDGYRRTDEATVAVLGHACAALELFHAAAMIHDDIIDESPTRRNHPAFHIGWVGADPAGGADGRETAPISASIPSARLGIAAGLLGGDALLVLTARAVDRIPSPARDRVAGFFQEMQLRTVVGEFQDSVLEYQRVHATRTAIADMSVNKTAWYTVIAPMVLAAHCADADTDALPLLIDAGSAFGEAFQLLDDLIEVYGEPAVTGKNPLDDLKAGKATLLHHIVAANCTPTERTVLAQVYGRGDGTERDLEQYRRLIDANTAHVTDDLRGLMDRARSLLREAGFRDHTVDRIEHELSPHFQIPVPLDESA
ncbi:polyprenyl synthetase family protein [Nonomuraea sp. H19]|uniref:polyprenyl synthetase family protein n=1 Tax=Nonomuraea sp. H19 TaxID=3452206 RepID=UPI003F8AFEBB